MARRRSRARAASLPASATSQAAPRLASPSWTRRRATESCFVTNTEHFISVASTQATRIKHHDMLTRACAVFLFEHPSVVSNSCSFSTALFLSLATSLAGP